MIIQNGKRVLCHTVLQIRYRMLAAQEEQKWQESLRLVDVEKEHCQSCPKCNPTWFAADLFPGMKVEVTG